MVRTIQPSLSKHLDEMQRQAYRAAHLLEVVSHLENDDSCPNGRIVVSEIALELTLKVANGLDIVNRPEVAE